MLKRKLQDTQRLKVNQVLLFGTITQKGDIGKSKQGNFAIKFILSDTIFCICAKETAEMVNILKIGTQVSVEGRILRINDKNVVYAEVVESYTTQEKIDVKKLKKELKLENHEF